MKAVILNSGMGTRMGVLTKEHPKCMTEVSESETILSAQLNKLVESGIQDVVITTGFFHEVLIDYCDSLGLPLNIEYVYNPIFDQTNYIYSIYCAYETLRDSDILLMHGDLVFESEVLKKVMVSEESCMTISTTVPLPEKDFKAVMDGNRITAVGINFFDQAVAAQPLYKLFKKDWNVWLDEIRNYCENGKTTCYAENAFNDISSEICLRGFDIQNLLCNEVDNYDDLCVVSERYRQLSR